VAVSVDSIGYYKYYQRLYLDLGMVMSSITAAFLKQQDKRKLSNQKYEKEPARRKIRAQKRLDNINFEWKRQVIDKRNGNTYHTAMMALAIASQLLTGSDGSKARSEVIYGSNGGSVADGKVV
jgi:hypothetical protein